MKSKFILIFCFSLGLNLQTSAKSISVTDFGAVGDGLTLNTAFIQKAIDNCSETGGGQVIFPAGGKFLSGTINLKNNVTLYLEEASVLLGSPDFSDYKPKNLIRAKNLHNIGIKGPGSIDGQGSNFWIRKPDIPDEKKTFAYRQTHQYEHKEDNSGNLIEIVECTNIIIKDVTLKNAESWTLHLLACHTVNIQGIKIRNPFIAPNSDGIDIHHTSNVLISDCDIFTADDAIVIKTGDQKYLDKPCRNITVTNCIITNLTSAIKTGTGTYGKFENIVVSNCVFACGLPSDDLAKPEMETIIPEHWGNAMGANTGIAILCVDGGSINGFHVSNVVMKDIRCPIFIRLGNRVKENDKRENPKAGTLSNVKISDITATGAALASSIQGIPGNFIERVSLNNITIQTKGSGSKKLTQNYPEEKEDSYPRSYNWGNLHVSGLFVRHAKELTMRDINITLDAEDERPLADFNDVKNIFCDNWTTDNKTKSGEIVTLRAVEDARFSNIIFPGTKKRWFVKIGDSNSSIILR